MTDIGGGESTTVRAGGRIPRGLTPEIVTRRGLQGTGSAAHTWLTSENKDPVVDHHGNITHNGRFSIRNIQVLGLVCPTQISALFGVCVGAARRWLDARLLMTLHRIQHFYPLPNASEGNADGFSRRWVLLSAAASVSVKFSKNGFRPTSLALCTFTRQQDDLLSFTLPVEYDKSSEVGNWSAAAAFNLNMTSRYATTMEISFRARIIYITTKP